MQHISHMLVLLEEASVTWWLQPAAAIRSVFVTKHVGPSLLWQAFDLLVSNFTRVCKTSASQVLMYCGRKARNQLAQRPWRVDDLDAFSHRWFGKHGNKSDGQLPTHMLFMRYTLQNTHVLQRPSSCMQPCAWHLRTIDIDFVTTILWSPMSDSSTEFCQQYGDTAAERSSCQCHAYTRC